MTEFNVPTPLELGQIVKRTKLTSREFGEAVGYSDAERTVRALVKGERHGKTYKMSGTAIRSLTYLLALHKVYAAHADYIASERSEDMLARLDLAVTEAAALLPKKMQK